MEPFDTRTRTIDYNGKTYRIELYYSEDQAPPWEIEDGHGPVSGWERRNKAPGERVLNEYRDLKRFYDIRGAMQKALAEGWDAPPYGQGTKRQQAARAVDADFKRLRAWCAGSWSYVGVVVTEQRCDADGYEYDGPTASLCGIESDAGDYLDQVARELIEELATPAVACRVCGDASKPLHVDRTCPECYGCDDLAGLKSDV